MLNTSSVDRSNHPRYGLGSSVTIARVIGTCLSRAVGGLWWVLVGLGSGRGRVPAATEGKSSLVVLLVWGVLSRRELP